MAVTTRAPFLKLVLEGGFGDQLSECYETSRSARELRSALDSFEIAAAAALRSGIEQWPQLQVMMAFIWPCGRDFEGPRARYIESERLLEVSICIEPQEFADLP